MYLKMCELDSIHEIYVIEKKYFRVPMTIFRQNEESKGENWYHCKYMYM